MIKSIRIKFTQFRQHALPVGQAECGHVPALKMAEEANKPRVAALKAAKGKETNSLPVPWRDHSPDYTLVWTQ